MKKQQSFDQFAKNYKPLRFKFLGLTLTEHMPRETSFDWPSAIRVRIKLLLGMPINYFDLRSSLTTGSKKRADMAFLTHVIRERDRDAESVSRTELWRYRHMQLRYWPELWHANLTIGSKQTDNYMLRWGYLLDYTPSFTELIHGTDNDTALYAFENLE